jgi:serine protease
MFDPTLKPEFSTVGINQIQNGNNSLIPRSVTDRSADLSLNLFASKYETSLPKLSIDSISLRCKSSGKLAPSVSSNTGENRANFYPETRSKFVEDDDLIIQKKHHLLDQNTQFSSRLRNRLSGFKPSNVDPLTGLPTTNPRAVNTQTADRLINPGNLAISTVLHVKGTLRADRFTHHSNYQYTVFSGKGNVDFGSGYRDFIDLSNIHSRSVRFNLANHQGGGVVFNPGNGSRVFDALTLSNGRHILFEGMDSIQFSDGIVNLTVIPNDPLFARQSSLHSMGVHNAWRFTTGSNRVLIGVQDSGLGTNQNGFIHPELRNTTVYSNNYRDEFGLPESHGTGVQGIIAARSNNGVGLSGINWNSNVFHIDVLDGNFGDQTLEQATQNMITAAAQNGQRLVINMSLGTRTFNQIPAVHANFVNVVRNNPNTLFVIAAGNSGHQGQPGLASPATLAQHFNNVIAVGASWGTHDRDGFTRTPGQRIQYNWWGSQYGPGLTLMAPSEVYSTKTTRNHFGQVEFGYYLTGDRFNGTSAAAPNVAGVASLAWSANSRLSAAQIKGILSQTAYDLGTPGYDHFYGHGFVNADASVRQAMAYARA